MKKQSNCTSKKKIKKEKEKEKREKGIYKQQLPAKKKKQYTHPDCSFFFVVVVTYKSGSYGE